MNRKKFREPCLCTHSTNINPRSASGMFVPFGRRGRQVDRAAPRSLSTVMLRMTEKTGSTGLILPEKEVRR